MVETEDLVMRYPAPASLGGLVRGPAGNRGVLALDRVSFAVGEGEVFGLLGPNGAGKTTLINILSTLIIPSAGVARIGGRDVRQDAAGARRLVGLVTSNDRSFYWRLTGRQNLRFFAELQRVPGREIKARTEELLAALDIEAYADRRFETYSTGVRQRYAFARALLHRPRVIFMDEPTKGLDPNAAALLLDVIKDRVVRRWRPTIIITSHNLREIEQLCGRVAIMDRGRVLCCGTIDALRQGVQAHATYRLVLSGVPDACVDAIGTIPGVREARPVGDGADSYLTLTVQVTGGGKTLSEVLGKILSEGGEVHDCSSVPVSLDDVFRYVVPAREDG